MPHASDPSSLATVSRPFIEDWLVALEGCSSVEQMRSYLRRAGLDRMESGLEARVTLDQIVTLYRIAAVESGDEMMGLWSRPVRARALQHLVATVSGAETLPAALFRFSTFWNLLLDDFRCDLKTTPERLELSLAPLGEGRPQRFGHLLMLKLAHGLLSWRAGHELPVAGVRFAFPRPDFAADYAVVFPAAVAFGAPRSAISFHRAGLEPPPPRSKADQIEFVRRAPRDWIFTRFREHAVSLRVREFLFREDWSACGLKTAAAAFGTTPRTLMRRLDAEGASFRSIKDGLRRDIAIRDLREGEKNLERIAQELGFSSAANFHRAFRRWTGSAPSAFRRMARKGEG